MFECHATGDIGNFSQSFGTAANRMGGLLAGLGGAGSNMGLTGFIQDVKATRIAAIYAGDSSTAANALTFINRVNSIAKITANAIGADLDQDGTFDFINAGPAGFALGSGDTAIDGLVLAISATELSKPPLQQILG